MICATQQYIKFLQSRNEIELARIYSYFIDKDPTEVVWVPVRQEVDVEGGCGGAPAQVGAGRPPVVPGVDGPEEVVLGLHPDGHHPGPARGGHGRGEHSLHPGAQLIGLGVGGGAGGGREHVLRVISRWLTDHKELKIKTIFYLMWWFYSQEWYAIAGVCLKFCQSKRLLKMMIKEGPNIFQ